MRLYNTFVSCCILARFFIKNVDSVRLEEQNFTAKFSYRIIARARVHYLPRNFEVVKLTQVYTLYGPARRGACELSDAILRRGRLLVNRAATAFYFQRNGTYDEQVCVRVVKWCTT